MTVYGVGEHPCVIDGDIVKHLSRDARAYIKSTDSFVYYREDGAEGVDIVLSNFDGEETFACIKELKEYMNNEVEIFMDD